MVGTLLLYGALLIGVSASPLQQADGVILGQIANLMETMKEVIVDDKKTQEQIGITLQQVADTQENFERFMLGGARLPTTTSESESTAVESEEPQHRVDSNMAFFTRSVVTALNSGNNTQLAAILKELKGLNAKFDQYFKPDVCPESFVNLGDECFNFQLEDLTWEQSRERCLRLGGDLAIPKNLTQVRLFIGQNFPRKNRRNFWLGGVENGKVWEWLSGEGVDSTLWYTNEPSGNGKCLAMFDGWERPLSDFPCQNERRAICERFRVA